MYCSVIVEKHKGEGFAWVLTFFLLNVAEIRSYKLKTGSQEKRGCVCDGWWKERSKSHHILQAAGEQWPRICQQWQPHHQLSSHRGAIPYKVRHCRIWGSLKEARFYSLFFYFPGTARGRACPAPRSPLKPSFLWSTARSRSCPWIKTCCLSCIFSSVTSLLCLFTMSTSTRVCGGIPRHTLPLTHHWLVLTRHGWSCNCFDI